MNYIGSIYTLFHEVLQKQDGLSVGEKLFSIEKEIGASFIFAKDSEIFQAMEKFVDHPIDLEKDEPLSKEDFQSWVDSKFKE